MDGKKIIHLDSGEEQGFYSCIICNSHVLVDKLSIKRKVNDDTVISLGICKACQIQMKNDLN